MSDRSAYEDEMRRFVRLSDREVDALLAGEVPSTHEELEDVAAFFRDAAIALEDAPRGPTEARHIAAMVETAQMLAHSPATALPEGKVARFPRRRKLVSRSSFSSLAAKFAFAAVLALTAFSGAAYAGALPDPVQRGVADVGGTIGLSLPGADENNVDQGDVNDVDQGNQRNMDDGAVNDKNEGAQDNVDEGAQNNVDEGSQNDVDEGAQNDVEDGAQNDVDEGAQNDVEDGAQNDVDEGAETNVDDGALNNVEESAQNDVDQDAENNVDGGAQSNQDEGAVEDEDAGAQNESDDGSQGNGEN